MKGSGTQSQVAFILAIPFTAIEKLMKARFPTLDGGFSTGRSDNRHENPTARRGAGRRSRCPGPQKNAVETQLEFVYLLSYLSTKTEERPRYRNQ